MKLRKLLWGLLGGAVASGAVISSVYLLRKPQSDDIVTLLTATSEQLMTVVHISRDRANQIIQLRTEEPFETWADLQKVNGLGLARIADIQTEGKLRL